MAELLKRIMLVDDDELLSEFALAVLNGGGFEVLYCPSGEDALAKLMDFNPQLILLDYVMPGMSGLDTLRSIKNIPEMANTPVVFMTGFSEIAGDESAVGESGAVDVIHKPFDPTSLVPQIAEIWTTHGS